MDGYGLAFTLGVPAIALVFIALGIFLHFYSPSLVAWTILALGSIIGVAWLFILFLVLRALNSE